MEGFDLSEKDLGWFGAEIDIRSSWRAARETKHPMAAREIRSSLQALVLSFYATCLYMASSLWKWGYCSWYLLHETFWELGARNKRLPA